MPHPMLAPLPYPAWKETKTTLHLMCQIVGKLRLGYAPYRAHWWNVALQPTVRGLSTGRMRAGDAFFEVAFDFIDHRLVAHASGAREPKSFALRDGLAIADFYASLFALLDELGIRVSILDRPYDMGVTTPFSKDTEHAAYDAVMVRRWWQALLWSADVFDRFASEFLGKQSPAHLFWHGFDLALARFSGRPAAGPPKSDPVQQQAYSHEVIAVGFWPGDDTNAAPAYYTYTAPEPPALTSFALRPEGAGWHPSGSGHIGALAYDVVREAADPRATLLTFLHDGFDAGVRAAAWDVSALMTDFGESRYRADALPNRRARRFTDV